MIDRQRFDEIKATGLLPSPTGVALEILRLTQRDDVTIDEISRTVQTDPALSGRILKYANSLYIGASHPVSSVSQAIMRLGLNTVRTLALGLSVLSNSRDSSCKGFDYAKFWPQSLAIGVGMRVLCRQGAPAEERFTCGLLSQVGVLAFASVYPEKYADILLRWNHGTTEDLIQL